MSWIRRFSFFLSCEDLKPGEGGGTRRRFSKTLTSKGGDPDRGSPPFSISIQADCVCLDGVLAGSISFSHSNGWFTTTGRIERMRIKRIWLDRPIALRAVLTGVTVAAAGTVPWAGLVSANISHGSALPWSVPIMD